MKILLALPLTVLLSCCAHERTGIPVRIENKSGSRVELHWSDPSGQDSHATLVNQLQPGEILGFAHQDGGYPAPNARRLIILLDGKPIAEVELPPGLGADQNVRFEYLGCESSESITPKRAKK